MQSRRRFIKTSLGTAGLMGGLAGCAGGNGGGDGSGDGGDGGGDGGSDGGGGGGGDGGGSTTNGGSGGGDSDTVKAAWVDLREPGSDLWVNAQVKERERTLRELPWVDDSFAGGISRSESEQIFRDFANQDMDIIFGHAFDYMDVMLELSEEFPDIAWENATGFKTGENFAWYQCRVYQAYYLAGIAAGMVTESNTLGYVAAFPIAYAFRQLNAMTLGARSVNPDVTTKVAYIGTWYNPSNSTSAAQNLIDQGADVLSHMPNSPAVTRTARENDAWSIGQYMPQPDAGGEKYITSGLHTWQAHFSKELKAVRDGSWEATPNWGGFKEGYVTLDDWGPNVPEDAKSQAEEAKQRFFIDQEASIWDGTELEGISDQELYGSLARYVEGVEGEPPSG